MSLQTLQCDIKYHMTSKTGPGLDCIIVCNNVISSHHDILNWRAQACLASGAIATFCNQLSLICQPAIYNILKMQ